MVATFHPFSRLPLELRFSIWELTVAPREVEVRIVRPEPKDPLEITWSHPMHWIYINSARFDEAMKDVPTSTRAGRKARAKARREQKPYRPYVHMVSSEIPATLHACREARHHGLYQRVSLDDEPNSDSRYVWLNLDIDLVNIGTSFMAYFLPVASTIKQLKFSRVSSDEYWENENGLLESFSSVNTIHVVCIDGFMNWGDLVSGYRWPCALDRIVFIDHNLPMGHLAVDFQVLEKIFDMLWEGGPQAVVKEYQAGNITTLAEVFNDSSY